MKNKLVKITIEKSMALIYIGKRFTKGVNLTVQDLLCQDARIQDLYFNISEMKLSITSLFSVQIMSYIWVSDIIYISVTCGAFKVCVHFKTFFADSDAEYVVMT